MQSGSRRLTCSVLGRHRVDRMLASWARSSAAAVSRVVMRLARRCRHACWRCAFVVGIPAGQPTLRNESALTGPDKPIVT
jgi:hypothetical protein